MEILIEHLMGISKDFRCIAEKIDGLARALETMKYPTITETPQLEEASEVIPEAPAQAPTDVAAPAQAIAPTRKVSGKKRVAKKKETDIDKFVDTVRRARKDIDVATLMKRTGFNKKKIFNLIYKATRQGKIKRVSKGVYTKV